MVADISGSFEAVQESVKTNWPEAVTTEASVVLCTHYLARLFNEKRCRIQASFGLDQREYEVLAALRSSSDGASLTPKEINRAMLMSSGGLTKVLQRLEEQGLIERDLGKDDQRTRPVRLTEDGAVRVQQTMQALQELDAKRMSSMPAEELKTLQRLQQKLILLCEKE